MRGLRRNKRTFHYYLYNDRIPILDERGHKTGEYTLSYHPPVECKGNISAGNGDAQVELFGTGITYNKVIIVDDVNCPITETSLLCVDICPRPYNPCDVPPHDYVVKAVAKSLNSVAIAISMVNADEN